MAAVALLCTFPTGLLSACSCLSLPLGWGRNAGPPPHILHLISLTSGGCPLLPCVGMAAPDVAPQSCAAALAHVGWDAGHPVAWEECELSVRLKAEGSQVMGCLVRQRSALLFYLTVTALDFRRGFVFGG